MMQSLKANTRSAMEVPQNRDILPHQEEVTAAMQSEIDRLIVRVANSIRGVFEPE
jgi:hypothetical protein